MKSSFDPKARWLISLYWFIGILFVLLFIGLSFFARYATDDYYFIYASKELGIAECVKQCYVGFSGRWFAYALTCGLMNFFDFPYFLFSFYIVLFILYLLVFFAIIKKLFQNLSIDLKLTRLVQYTLLFFAGVFFTTFDKAESWFWYTSVCSYLLSLLAFLFCLILIFTKDSNAIHFCFLFIVTAFIGGASEGYSFSFLFILSLLILISYSIKQPQRNFLSKGTQHKLLFSSIVMLFSFAITAFAPGNYERISLLPKPDLEAQLIQPIKSLAQLVVYSIVPNLHHYLLFTFPWYLIGLTYFKGDKINPGPVKRKVLLVLFFVFLLCLIFMLPGILILHETPPGRALLPISVLIYSILALSFFLLGRNLNFRPLWLNQASKIYSGIFICYLSIYVAQQLYIAANYAKAFDERMIEIDRNSEKGKDIVLKALPASGLIYSAEISRDVDFYSNQHLQHALRLNVTVRKE